MITTLRKEDAEAILEMGRDLHKESHFNDEPYEVDRVWQILEHTVKSPKKMFAAIDEQHRGFILMTCNDHYFSGIKRTSDLALYIKPEHRGGMLVVRLLEAAKQWSKEIGAKDMTIFHNTGIATDKAPQLFKKLGFDMKGYIFTQEIQ
jgi:GNAT superfamily N-acetyltransferase